MLRLGQFFSLSFISKVPFKRFGTTLLQKINLGSGSSPLASIQDCETRILSKDHFDLENMQSYIQIYMRNKDLKPEMSEEAAAKLARQINQNFFNFDFETQASSFFFLASLQLEHNNGFEKPSVEVIEYFYTKIQSALSNPETNKDVSTLSTAFWALCHCGEPEIIQMDIVSEFLKYALAHHRNSHLKNIFFILDGVRNCMTFEHLVTSIDIEEFRKLIRALVPFLNDMSIAELSQFCASLENAELVEDEEIGEAIEQRVLVLFYSARESDLPFFVDVMNVIESKNPKFWQSLVAIIENTKDKLETNTLIYCLNGMTSMGQMTSRLWSSFYPKLKKFVEEESSLDAIIMMMDSLKAGNPQQSEIKNLVSTIEKRITSEIERISGPAWITRIYEANLSFSQDFWDRLFLITKSEVREWAESDIYFLYRTMVDAGKPIDGLEEEFEFCKEFDEEVEQNQEDEEEVEQNSHVNSR